MLMIVYICCMGSHLFGCAHPASQRRLERERRDGPPELRLVDRPVTVSLQLQ